jgi:hypothetical protein
MFVGVAVIASLAIVGVPAAMATPKGEFANFAQCPVHAEEVNACIYSPTTSGHVTLGNQEVPIVNTQVLQGGLLAENEVELFSKHMAGALNGETLTKTAQKVPGGLLGIKCKEIGNIIVRIGCEYLFEHGLAEVKATTELAAPASSVVLNTFSEATGLGPEQGYPPALALPVKVKLENSLFGSECYIGSNKEPMNIDLITGATKGGPTGNPGKRSSNEEGSILHISGVSLVSNTFSAPKATGCGIGGVLDGLINEKLGLPSTKNTAVLNGSVEIANSAFVEESE